VRPSTNMLENVSASPLSRERPEVQYNQFHRIAKADIQKSPDGISKPVRYTFCGVGQETSKWNDSNCVHSKDNGWVKVRKMRGDPNRDENQENIDP
jgi:hypothetical protein